MDIHAPLSECGFDISKLSELAEIINKKFSLEITYDTLFRCTTIVDVSKYLVNEHKDVLKQNFFNSYGKFERGGCK